MATERPGPSRLLTGAFLAAALVVGAALGAQEINGLASPLDRIENLTLDWRFLLAGARPAPSSVVIVAIDDEALSEAGGDAPPREMMARIVRALAGFHPRAIAIDIAFLNSKDEATDAELARALKAAPAVVAAIGVFDPAHRSSGETEPSDLALAPKPSSVLWPIEAIRDAAQVGLANVSTDSSGVPRYIPMIYQTPDGVLPSFALAAASQALEVEPVFGPDRIEIAGRSREMDLGYHMPVRFYGPEGSFRRISAAQVLRGDLDPEALRGKVVVVGVTATGASDTFATPFDRVAPGAEVFATAIGNLLAGDGLARTPSTRRIDAVAAVALPVVMIALMAMRRAAIGLVLASLVFVLWLAWIFLAFVHGYWLERRVAARLGPAVDRRLRRGPLHCRTPGRDEDRRREVDALQVSLAAPSRPPFERARFPGEACPPGCRGDVPGSFGIDRRSGGAWTRRDARPFQRDADTGRGRGDCAWRSGHHLHGRWRSRGVRFAEAAQR